MADQLSLQHLFVLAGEIHLHCYSWRRSKIINVCQVQLCPAALKSETVQKVDVVASLFDC